MNHQSTPSPQELTWWQRGVIYQLWLRAYYDTDDNGQGDLKGLIAKLDYLAWLGVDIIWLSPIYPSPMIEGGYDVSNYTDVNELFGSLEDFDRLMAEAHQRNLKVILDFVPNHTSDAHPWFYESRSSRDNSKRDWYIWQDPGPNGSPPNNWVSCFGGSAWTYDKETGQYYYHAFLAQQPDLNWRNPQVQEAIFDAMRFWLSRGIDAFRMDAIWHLIKDDQLRDNPPNPQYTPDMAPDNCLLPIYTRGRQEVHPIIARMRQVVDEFDDRMLSGELYMDCDEMATYYGSPEQPELHLPLNLQLSVLNWNVNEIADYIERYEQALPPGAWPNWAVSTHDSPRIASRAGANQAGVAAMLLLTLRGTPTIYYGDEIGMQCHELPREVIKDPRELLTPYRGLGRDPSRSPMQWDTQPNAGFTYGKPWQPVPADFERVNVNAQSDDPQSVLTLYRRLLRLRRETPALIMGSYQTVHRDASLFVYQRQYGEQRFLIALNFSGEPCRTLLDGAHGTARIVLTTRPGREGEVVQGDLELHPNEGIILSFSD